MKPSIIWRVVQPILLVGFILMRFAAPVSVSTAMVSADEHLAILLVLDNSGSMKTSDPTNLRYTGAQLLVSLLDRGDAAGVLRFASTSRPITSGMVALTTSEQQAHLVATITSEPPDGYTDVKAAFETARTMLQAFNASGFRTVVIFLTDGKPEIPEPYAGYEQEALEAARSLGAPVLSVALTRSGQTPFLSRLAVETGGTVIFANTAADLLDTYLQILGDLKDRTILGSGSANAPGEAAFDLDPALIPYVDRVSFVVSKPTSAGVSLILPGGEPFSPADQSGSAVLDPRFAVYTVADPASGSWHFALSGSGPVQARVILYSRLRGRLVSPAYIFEAGQPVPLVVHLVEEPGSESTGQSPVTLIGEATFSAWITRPDGTRDSLDRFYDDGSHGDALASDGLYTREYVNTTQAGPYQIEFRAHKGAIPVTFHAQLHAVPFPEMVLDQPSEGQYDIRDQPVPIQIHLAETGAALDQGIFAALITPPQDAPESGVERVALACSGEVCQGEYFPRTDGHYRLQVVAENANYQGLPYLRQVETVFDARIISTVRLISFQIGLDEEDQGSSRYELIQAQQGILVWTTFSSTASTEVLLTPHLEGLPGFRLLETGAFPVAPGPKTRILLHVQADPALGPGVETGQLVFIPPDGVDLVGSGTPLTLELFQAEIAIMPRVMVSLPSSSCLASPVVQVTLHIVSNSLSSETLAVHLENLAGVRLAQEQILVNPGESEVTLTLQPDGKGFKPGDYAGRLVIDDARPGLRLDGGASYPLDFVVAPAWVTCRKPLIISGAALGFGLMLLTTLWVRARRNAAPPQVSGTLIYWDQAAPSLTTTINLTALKKTEVSIGKSSQNAIVIPDDSLQERHAILLAERDEQEGVRIILHPIAPVRRGYRECTADQPLEESVLYQMGRQMLKFIRDLDIS